MMAMMVGRGARERQLFLLRLSRVLRGVVNMSRHTATD